jgi:hypothetical protein
MLYSKDEKGNLDQRAIMLAKCAEDKDAQDLIVKQCGDDILFFFNMLLWTYKPKAVGSEWEPESPNLPFITYPYQDDFILEILHHIENQEDSSTEKSREMWFSWMILWVFLWGWLFRGWSFLIGSYKLEYVDELGNMDSALERIRYMLDRLPFWMKPHDIVSKHKSISSKTLGAEIAGDVGENFGTGWRRKAVFVDEFPLWRDDQKVFRKTKDVTNCRIFGGTPEGRFNVYGKIMTNHPDFSHLDIKKHTLHWRLHPLKDEAWYEKQKRSRTKLDLAKEVDISYDDSVTWAVYPDFNQIVRVRKVEHDPKRRAYTSWDFGRDSNALIFWEKDFETWLSYVVRTIRKKWWHIAKFAAFVTWVPTQGHSYDAEELAFIEWSGNTYNNTYSNHFWDPYNGDALTTNATESIKTILGWMGIHLHLKSGSTVEWRIRGTTLALNRMIVNENETDFIQSMIQSHYPQVRENSQAVVERTKPVHDENSHFRTSCEYYWDNEAKTAPTPINQPRIFINKLSGKYQVSRNPMNPYGLSQR